MSAHVTNVVDGQEACCCPGYGVLSQLTPKQLAATHRLVLWINNTEPTENQVWLKMLRTCGGDHQFAATIRAAIEATRKPRLQAANDPVAVAEESLDALADGLRDA